MGVQVLLVADSAAIRRHSPQVSLFSDLQYFVSGTHKCIGEVLHSNS